MQSVPLIYRLILIVLLPCIAAVLYVTGQHYDPAMIDFKTMKATPASLPAASESAAVQRETEPTEKSAASPYEIAGFRAFGRERRYTKENLYEHVNGHAEYFISAGFQGLTVTEYVSSSKSDQPEIRAEVYDMGKGIQAFGVLADESGEGAVSIPVGAMGYKTSGGIGFIKGRYYVKLEALGKKTPLLPFATAYANALSATSDPFSSAFTKFPELGKAGRTKYVKEGYRGLDLLNNVIEREYLLEGKKITVALLAAKPDKSRAVLESLSDYFRKSRVPFQKIEGSEAYLVSDKYEGNWLLVPTRDSLFGIYGSDDTEILKYFGK